MSVHSNIFEHFLCARHRTRLSMFSACGEDAIESTDRIGVCGHDLWGLVMWHMGPGKEDGGSEGGY